VLLTCSGRDPPAPIVLAALGLLGPGRPLPAGPDRPDPVSSNPTVRYEVREVEGGTVRWSTGPCSGRRPIAPSGLVRAAFERAMEANLHESVLRINGKVDRASTATNPMEDFAETAEVFFGTNDVLSLRPPGTAAA